jgi:hypothetical protein
LSTETVVAMKCYFGWRRRSRSAGETKRGASAAAGVRSLATLPARDPMLRINASGTQSRGQIGRRIATIPRRAAAVTSVASRPSLTTKRVAMKTTGGSPPHEEHHHGSEHEACDCGVAHERDLDRIWQAHGRASNAWR